MKGPYSPVDRASVVSLLILNNIYRNQCEENTIRKISGILHDLREKGVHITDLGLDRRIGGDYYSEFVDSTVYLLNWKRSTTSVSGFNLNQEGIKFCGSNVLDELNGPHKAEFLEIARMLKIDMPELLKNLRNSTAEQEELFPKNVPRG